MKITLDGNELTAKPGQTILDVARQQGVHIPTLCYRKTCYRKTGDDSCSSTSCLVCLVKVRERFVPACATRVEDGMVVESETDEVRQLRKASLELLLSDHIGDCHAPCQFGCPAGLDVPKMLREIRRGDWFSAIRTIKENIPLPAVLGRVCPKPCEKICRRRAMDSPVEICEMKRYVADVDLNQDSPYRPELAPATGKRIIVVGAGPSGLSAAYYLAVQGHHVSLYAQGRKPGGRLRLFNPDVLPESVLEAEIKTILDLPIEYYPGERLDWTNPGSFEEIRQSFDAVLLCTGPCDKSLLEKSGFETEYERLKVDSKTFTTSIPGVFATGTIFRAKSTMIVRSVADGREAALSVDRFLRDGKPHAARPPFSVRLGKLAPAELIALADAHLDETVSSSGPDEESGPTHEASRCLHCDCRGREECRLLKHSIEYGAQTNRFTGKTRQALSIRRSGKIVYEPGKCIKCGLCITTARSYEEELGLTFIGRGFDVKVGVPFDESLEKALEKSAAEAVRVCPTAALSMDGPKTFFAGQPGD